MVKTKKKNLSEVTQHKHNQQKKKTLNPFEIHINKDKQNVLGQKNKADRGLPGISRAKAINKRKGTLLQEYKLKNKDNIFLDKRIGEKNVRMTPEEKAMARFTAERIKAHKKKNIYSLNDEEVLTHRGQTLEEIEKFDDPKSDDEFSDDDRDGKLDKKFVDEAHFGGGILSKSNSTMSRKDLIEQLIAESKKRKAEKQKLREETIDLTEKLDTEWKDLLPIVSASKVSNQDPYEKVKADDYDMAVRELKFEARGNPSDRLKSEEEIIKEEKEKLETLEADRLARMKGFVSDSNAEIRHKSADDLDDGFVVEKISDEAQNDDINNDNEILNDNADQNSDNVSGDDNSDGDDNNDSQSDKNTSEIENEEEEVKESSRVDDKTTKTPKSKVSKEPNTKENEEEHDTDIHENSDQQSDSNDSEALEDNLSDLKESDCSSEDEEIPAKKSVRFGSTVTSEKLINSKKAELKSIIKTKNEVVVNEKYSKSREQEIRNDLLRRKEIMEKARKELPYTYEAPESYEELQKLLENQNPDYQSVIVDRIIKCNHWSLDKQNKEKLSKVFMFLLQYICSNSIKDNSEESIVNSFLIFDRLCPYLYDLAHSNPENAKNCMVEIIREKHEEFEENKKEYPNIDTLMIFKLVSLLFPTSDFRHVIVTPCVVFMSQILLRCRIKNRKDIARGLFICTLILEYTVLSKRFAPSAINFLRGIIYMATPKLSIKGTKVIPPFKIVGELSNLLIINSEQADLEIDSSTALMKAYDLVCEDIDNDFKIRALFTALNLVSEFKSHLQELQSAYSIFEPIMKLLKENVCDGYPSSLKKNIKQLCEELMSLKNKKLEYIVREKKRPKPLRQYEPRIETVYDGKRHKSMSKEKAEKEKLLHKYKKEMKGAIREIRRDRAFLSKLQIKQQIKSDTERKRKVKEIFGDAAQQQHELKKFKKK
ncbi:hypothetical protein KPH14_006910 [Odynerus spinipes]|uniref:Nucleolar protein 14 n=1 Tax=Odynerus spinipes TaxID=1348599 RepID=A0AAD9RSQ0_9HYME|nr:hypothetical protein KPH14_006910 [Odynerus spinipes]